MAYTIGPLPSRDEKDALEDATPPLDGDNAVAGGANVAPNVVEIASSGEFDPSDYTGTMCHIEMWGGGGGAGQYGGGGGGGYIDVWLELAKIDGIQTVIIPSGAAGSTEHQGNYASSQVYFGWAMTMYGGGGGSGNLNTRGGLGGGGGGAVRGVAALGETSGYANGGDPLGGAGDWVGTGAGISGFGGGGGGYGEPFENGGDGGASVYGGGGGGGGTLPISTANDGGDGGSSVHGGGGGGGAGGTGTNGVGGVSTYGGNGGDAPGGTGNVPGGGGGGFGGTGGQGLVVVTIYP